MDSATSAYENTLMVSIFFLACRKTSSSLYCWSSLRAFRAHQESTLGQIWSKLLIIFEKLGFDIKPWKIFFYKDFDLVWPLINLWLTRGIFVILAEKDTLSAPISERVMPHHYICSRDPMEGKWYFWIFGVWHANWRPTKYGINNCPFFI